MSLSLPQVLQLLASCPQTWKLILVQASLVGLKTTAKSLPQQLNHSQVITNLCPENCIDLASFFITFLSILLCRRTFWPCSVQGTAVSDQELQDYKQKYLILQFHQTGVNTSHVELCKHKFENDLLSGTDGGSKIFSCGYF